MLDVSEARRRLLDSLERVDKENIDLHQADGRVLAEDLTAPAPSPRFSNSSMDGFAIHAEDAGVASQDTPVSLPVVGDIPAGSSTSSKIKAGEAMRIMTGAPTPEGAAAVIPVEDTDFNHRDEGSPTPDFVSIFRKPEVGENIRLQGEDYQQGHVLIGHGHRLRPQDTGLFAMTGHSHIFVFKKPLVGVISTGDELLPVESELTPGKIHDSNSYTISALIKSCGCDVIQGGIVPDDEASITQALNRFVQQGVDLIISSAGVSVGVFDYVRKVVEDNGQLKFWRVNMRPGKPLVFGNYKNTPFIGLPGNPVSSFVGFEVFLRPALNFMGGDTSWVRRVVKAVIEEDARSDGRESYLRVILESRDGVYYASQAGHQGSGNLHSLVLANGLIILPAGVQSIHAGSLVDAWFLT